MVLSFLSALTFGQSGRVPIYSESSPTLERKDSTKQETSGQNKTKKTDDDEVIRVETDLIIVPTQITERNGRAVTDIRRQEFKIFENGIEQEIAYFSAGEQPFTVVLMLDMSYSSVFKLSEIQAAALEFINQLKPDDKVMIVSFDKEVRVLCQPTNNRYALKLAVEAARIASGTSLYSAFDKVFEEYLGNISGRKAIVLLSDGVDTTSQKITAKDILASTAETDVLVYPIQYDTYEDVQKTRKNQAEIRYDEDDRPYSVEKPQGKGERWEDYREADNFLKDISNQTGGKKFRVNSNTNLRAAFTKIAEELRRVYSLGYYPSSERQVGVRYSIKVRVYRPNLIVRARSNYILSQNRR